MSALSVDRTEPLIAARSLSAGYGATPVIRNVDLEVRSGEVVALLGANGAGKSTTLQTLAGVLRPSGGAVVWNGKDHWLPLHRRARQGLAYLPEDRSVFGRLTTEQNFAVGRERNLEAALTLFPELERLLKVRGGMLSGGEQRMLAVARALGGKTRLLLADELSLGLAPRTVGVLLRQIRRAADRGLGVLIVEQHVHRALEIADRVYVMQGGRICLVQTASLALEELNNIQGLYLADAAVSSGAAPGPGSKR